MQRKRRKNPRVRKLEAEYQQHRRDTEPEYLEYGRRKTKEFYLTPEGRKYQQQKKREYWHSKRASDPEYKEKERTRLREKERRRRAAKVNSPQIEEFTDLEIFERDNWSCQLCLEPVDQSLKWPNKMCSSLDHIHPLLPRDDCFPGTHTTENVQLTHFICNAKKHNKCPHHLKDS